MADGPAFIAYVDDSGDEAVSAFSALLVPIPQWKECFARIKQVRSDLKDSRGLYVKKEWHAWKFVSGRGRFEAVPMGKQGRVELYLHLLGVIASLPGVRLINACDQHGTETILFERLLNRIHVNMHHSKGQSLIFCDEGKEGLYTKLARKMAVHNPITSKFGYWPGGSKTKNIPIERIVEDIVFKDSRQSYFVQLADFCAYALLRNQHPIPSKSEYGLDDALSLLDSIMVKEAFRDPLGIIRAS